MVRTSFTLGQSSAAMADWVVQRWVDVSSLSYGIDWRKLWSLAILP
jgi:hypothetical protein